MRRLVSCYSLADKKFDAGDLVENRTTRICDFNETKEWNWDNPEMMRVIDGWQVTSMEMLFEIMCYKAERGYEEVELYEAPRFMLLAGG